VDAEKSIRSAIAVDLTERLKSEALRLGFDLVGIAPAVVPSGYPRFREWLEAGCGAEMAYLDRQAEPRRHPESILDGVKTVIMVGVVYGQAPERAPEPNEAKIARYAQGGDYHEFLWDRLGTLLGWLQSEIPDLRGRAIADTAPLLERDFAQLAGLGWQGKNTMLINPRVGSYTLLGALLIDMELPCDSPFAFDRCGTCTRCLDACPTDAFDGPHRLDARRCISYWTIEHRGPIPDTWAENLDGWAFGCDICQDVCPWNRKAPPGRQPSLSPREEWKNPDLLAWLDRDAAAWKAILKGTAQKRSKRAGLVRNACLILGTRQSREAIPSLRRLLADEDETIRWAADWALRKIGGSDGGTETPTGPNPS
jgi:epoxyqueuosine reductase